MKAMSYVREHNTPVLSRCMLKHLGKCHDSSNFQTAQQKKKEKKGIKKIVAKDKHVHSTVFERFTKKLRNKK